MDRSELNSILEQAIAGMDNLKKIPGFLGCFYDAQEGTSCMQVSSRVFLDLFSLNEIQARKINEKDSRDNTFYELYVKIGNARVLCVINRSEYRKAVLSHQRKQRRKRVPVHVDSTKTESAKQTQT